MSRPATSQELQAAIIRTLKTCAEYLLPQERLIDEVRLRHPDARIGEVMAALDVVETNRWAVADRHKILGVRWQITSAGKLVLET